MRCGGFVVRAMSAKKARKFVSELKDNGTEEGPGDEGGRCWLDPFRTSSRELKEQGKEEVILRDFHAG
jgi:hypothetical protein